MPSALDLLREITKHLTAPLVTVLLRLAMRGAMWAVFLL